MVVSSLFFPDQQRECHSFKNDVPTAEFSMGSIFFNSPFLRARRKKDFPSFPVGRPRPEPSPKPSPCRLPFSLLERVDLSPRKSGFWGRKLAGEGWGGQGKKGKKDAQKKVGKPNSDTCLGRFGSDFGGPSAFKSDFRAITLTFAL